MNVGELKAHLADLPDDMDIIYGSDDEGNDFLDLYYSPVIQWCVEDDTRCGFRPVADEDVDTEYDRSELVQKVVM